MGEIADQIIDNYLWGFGGSAGRGPRTWQSGAGSMRWRDQTGRVHDMRRMSLGHLRAAERKAESEGNTGKLADLRRAIREREQDLLKPVDNP